MGYNLEELQWKCQDCDASAPPTAYDYMRLLKHKKGHHVRLVVAATGEVVATTAKEARAKGIDLPRKTSAGKPRKKAEGDDETVTGKLEERAEGGGMELTEEGIILPVTLPAVVFTMFDAAKAAKLVDEDKDFDSWLFECVQKRFLLDYGLQLMLVPVAEGK